MPASADLAARRAALDILVTVLDRRRPLDEALETQRGFARLPERERAFARLMVATVLRRLGQLDALIDSCLQRPLPAKARVVRHVLRLGAAQLLFLQVAPHAAVDTAVELARALHRPGQAGLVNALLRRLAREGAERLAAQDAPRLNTPAWLWRRWTAAYGEETARAIAAAHMAEPPLDITVKADAGAWAEPLEAEILPTGSLRRATAPVAALPGYDAGAWWVQDAAAALPARLLGAIDGRRVADLCAAPGGKTAQLAAAGARVVAVDASQRRLERLRRNLERLGLEAETVTADAAEWSPDERFDAVLLDAPCTSTGTARRHPDIPWLKRPRDVAAMAAVQQRLLDNALRLLAPGGTLVYCVCSLEPEEGVAQVERLVAEGRVARRPVAPGEVGGLSEIVTTAGDVRSLPCHLGGRGGMDGFYAARLIPRA